MKLFNNVRKKLKIPEDLEMALMINIHKKVRKDKCRDYREITLLDTASKLQANVFKENRLTSITEGLLDECQRGFKKGRRCVDAVFTLKQLLEERREINLPLFLLFLDRESLKK